MKKSVVLFGILLLVFTFGINLALAADANETQAVQKAYKCLENATDTKTCSKLSLSEQIFSLMAIGECKAEVLKNSDKEECWPDARCDIKTTAQAILALHEVGANTDKAKTWLLENTRVPTDLTWYLEIESEEAVSCSIDYLGSSYNIEIAENKIINQGAGSCLSLGPGGYWLEINPSCYEEEYEVSCSKSFITTLLFKNFDSSTIHVLDVTHSAPEYGTTLEKINSFCFATGQNCDYEGNAWATMVLNALGEDVSAFIPYLTTSQKREYFPEPFLYILTGFSEYKSGILNQQINKQYWKVSKDKYYDSALALLPFQNQELDEKDFTKDWLLEIQQSNGCWDGGNIRNNAFILYSLWPRNNAYINHDDENESEQPDNGCKESGFFCMIPANCNGEKLANYNCIGSTQVCCDTEYVEQTCQEIGGKICSSNQFCTGNPVYSGYLSYGEECCLTGYCQTVLEPEENTCEQNFGTCESYECGSGYSESLEYSCDYGNICCMPEETTGGYWWIWVLFVLIILIVFGIIYKDKLQMMLLKMQHKDGPTTSSGNPRMPPTYSRDPHRPLPTRRIIPQQRQVPRNQFPRTKSPQELDEVLKKLKDMSR